MRREALAQAGDDGARLVDRQRGLRDVGDPLGVGDLEAVDVLLGLDEHDVLWRLAHRALDLLMAGVADEHDRVALAGELQRLAVDLGDERARRVDRLQPARQRVGVHGGRHAVGREDGHRALGDRVVELLDEHGAAVAELLDDVLVVHDLLAHVDRRAVQLERALDRLHGPVDAGAVAARRGEQQLLRKGGHAPSVRPATPRGCQRWRARAAISFRYRRWNERCRSRRSWALIPSRSSLRMWATRPASRSPAAIAACTAQPGSPS